MASHPLIADIEAFIKTHEISEAKFGTLALGDWRFIRDLRGSPEKAARRVWPETEGKVRRFMATYRPAPQSAAA